MARSYSLRTELRNGLLVIGRWRFLQPAVRFFFKHMTHLLPLERLRENNDWVAFHHPQAAYPLHILILPKQGLSSLEEAPQGQPSFYSELFAIVKDLIKDFDLDTRGYRLITNGGPHQSIPQWHWHLISESSEE